MLSPKDIGSKANASSIWSFDSGYETSRAVSPSLQAHAPNNTRPYHTNNHTNNHTPVIFNAGDLWSAPSDCTRVREDSLVDPITTRLNVFTTSDAPDHSFVLPDLPVFDRTCLECEVWQLTNPGQQVKCQKCRAHSIHQALPTTTNPLSPNKDALPRLDIPGDMHGKGLKRLRPASRCSICEAPLLVESEYCPSCDPDQRFPPSSPSSPAHRVKRSRAGRNSKLPIAALNRLQSWLDANKHNPYPTADTKRWLAQECGITEKQVNTWFTNARARQMNKEHVESGSEVDGADDSEDAEAPQSDMGIAGFIQDKAHADSTHRRTSAAVRPSRRGKKKDYRRAHHAEAPQTPLLLSPASMTTSPLDQTLPVDQEMWQCTFCLKALVPKSWRRHEDTQHRPKTSAARWTCMLHGARLSFPNRTNSGSVCAFCMAKNPTEEHFLQNHRIDECWKRDAADRTFYRPDHLRQHIKNFHNATLFDIVQARWKTAAEPVAEGWTCGFCGDRLETWDKRETHISNHFKEGMTMASWRDYSDVGTQSDKKKGKGKAKEKEKITALSGSFLNIFRRPTPQQQQQQPQMHPQSSAFENPFQPLPIEPQIHNYQATTSQCTSTNYESAYTSSTAPMGLGISQAPVLPDIPHVSPLVVTQHDFETVGNYVEWAPMPTFEQQMQYQLPNTNTYDASVPTTTMQPDYTSLNAFGLDLYGNPLEYQGSWVQQPASSQDPHQYPQYQRRQQ
ncbi:hypothetical protein DPSP01_013918 [Paraphaeosphaeria sporulosa]|uniref:Homeobox domain-containing protein n=1 Tax=Paraphaeosphaeria sporulosa TaxID=1460663 RepID=A0A177CXI6_9PLEO|nr:uncharacterized protein CC84DRAFT_1254294 [Paraphaeosphaeria sporulosa]OAG11926.1 hypothetical protein CC84DRAFT_1254294 [Paraphaeosphaeria sporulosa]